MANIGVSVEKGVEVAAEDVLHWVKGLEKVVTAAPEVLAALAVLAASVERPLMDLAVVSANPLNIPMDLQTANDLRAAWPAVKAFLGSMGAKF